jgi:opacity protein-like surface antigen
MASISVAANAQSSAPEHRQWEFGAFGATSALGEHTSTTPQVGVIGATSREVTLKYSFAAEMGAWFSENLGEHWGANLEYRFSNQPLTFTNLADTIPTFNARQSIHRIAYEMLYYPLSPDHRARPYVFAGPGINLFHINQNSRNAASQLGMQLTSPWKATLNWGGGLKYLIQDHVAVNVHLIDTVSGVPKYGLPSSAQFSPGQISPGFDPKGLMHNWQLGFGLAYQFDAF